MKRMLFTVGLGLLLGPAAMAEGSVGWCLPDYVDYFSNKTHVVMQMCKVVPPPFIVVLSVPGGNYCRYKCGGGNP